MDLMGSTASSLESIILLCKSCTDLYGCLKKPINIEHSFLVINQNVVPCGPLSELAVSLVKLPYSLVGISGKIKSYAGRELQSCLGFSKLAFMIGPAGDKIFL